MVKEKKNYNNKSSEEIQNKNNQKHIKIFKEIQLTSYVLLNFIWSQNPEKYAVTKS